MSALSLLLCGLGYKGAILHTSFKHTVGTAPKTVAEHLVGRPAVMLHIYMGREA